MTTPRTTWPAQIAVMLVLLAAGSASASGGVLAGNSPPGKNSLEGGFRRAEATVSTEGRRAWGDFCHGEAADSVVAPKGLLNEGARATELADEALMNKLRERGFTIDQSAEIQRYLDYRKANAATFLEKDLLLRPDARKIEVLEEYLHNVQKDIGLMNKMTPAQTEIHVKDFMLRHKKMLGISDADAQWLKNWLDKAKGQ